MSRARVNMILLVVVAALIAACAALYFAGRPSENDRITAEYDEIIEASESMALAFLTVDHTRMDELTADVIDGATGTFKEQYESSLESLKDAATQQESFAEGTVDTVGLSEVDADSATAFVSAASEVRNTSTNGEPETRAWRIKLELVKESDRWLVSELEFVG